MGSVYILQLEHDCYYVGYTEDLQHRLKRHSAKHKKSEHGWLELHPFVSVIYTKDNVTKDYERYATLKMMKKYGWQNVRGAGWTRAVLESPPKALDEV
jgi:predicted GIY-YIG superfamily endonuclease